MNEWPDTDEDHLYLTYALNDSDEEPTHDSDFIWALYDSGSGLTTCPKEMFEDIEIVPSSRKLNAEAATGDAVTSFGKRSVPWTQRTAWSWMWTSPSRTCGR